mmetsp:Transcript_10116/g.44004  ORF Transcript_10116/g.44004 Transcript_10116/m.44004 type:complete len:204 (-) Transcript_10116:114-725(-)
MRGTHEKILSLEIPPNDSRILELLQALRHLQHDVELDLGGERDALALHEVLEVAVRAELGDHGEADVASVAAVAHQARVVLELGAAAAGVTENLGGDGWEAFDGGDLLDDGLLPVAIHDPRAHQLAVPRASIGGAEPALAQPLVEADVDFIRVDVREVRALLGDLLDALVERERVHRARIEYDGRVKRKSPPALANLSARRVT